MSYSTSPVLLFAIFTCFAVFSLTASASSSTYGLENRRRTFRVTAVSRQVDLDQLGEDFKKFAKDMKKGRAKYVKKVISHASSKGLNVVIVHPPSLSHGHDRIYDVKLGKTGFKIYVAKRNKVFQVTNAGDGGWINWGLSGKWWVRWGNTVRFHPGWNYDTMGTPYEVRDGPIPPI